MRCVPVMGFGKIPPGKQSNEKLFPLVDNAIKFLKGKLNRGNKN